MTHTRWPPLATNYHCSPRAATAVIGCLGLIAPPIGGVPVVFYHPTSEEVTLVLKANVEINITSLRISP